MYPRWGFLWVPCVGEGRAGRPPSDSATRRDTYARNCSRQHCRIEQDRCCSQLQIERYVAQSNRIRLPISAGTAVLATYRSPTRIFWGAARTSTAAQLPMSRVCWYAVVQMTARGYRAVQDRNEAGRRCERLGGKADSRRYGGAPGQAASSHRGVGQGP